jgi:uncharacterized protein (TIGR03435 family)
MMRSIRGMMLALVAGCATSAQTADRPLAFEVASVKPNPPTATGGGMHGCFGGPGTSDPGLYRCMQATVSLMAFQAYGLKLYQIGPDYYADKAEFNVTAKVPPGATEEQVKVMLQNLLVERFKLAFHYQKKEMAAYDLVVAKSGPKLAAAAPVAEPAPGAPARKGARMSRAGGAVTWAGYDMSMDAVVLRIGQQIGRPVFDATGLKGEYDFSVTFADPNLNAVTAPADSEPAPTIFEALEKQLGLKLEAKKAMIDVFVIDHMEKTPIGN